MGVERDGLVGTGDPARDAAVIGYFGDGATSQGDVNEAFVFASSYNAPVRLLLPEQPVGDLRADRAAVPDPAVPAGRRLRLPRRAGGRQRRARRARRHHGGPGTGPVGQRSDVHRGVHLPDGRAHHLRRPHEVPAGRRARALAAEGPDRAGPGLSDPRRRGRRGLLRRQSRRRPTSLAVRLRAEVLALPEPTLAETFDWVYADADRPAGRAAGRATPEYVGSFVDAAEAAR